MKIKTKAGMLTQKALKSGISLLRPAATEGQTVLLRAAVGSDGYEVVQRSHINGCQVVGQTRLGRLSDANGVFNRACNDAEFIVGA